MAIDYSKWDKLELSDDSDIEVHPNVDKKSFIRWRQRDIHEKRAVRKQKMEDIKGAMAMNRRLLSRISEMETVLEKESPSDPYVLLGSFLEAKKSEDMDSAIPGGMSYHHMLMSLLKVIKDAEDTTEEKSMDDSAKCLRRLKSHKERLLKLLEDAQKEYDTLEAESKNYITSEDLHLGFDSTYVQKKEPEKPKKTKTKKETIQVIESLNNPTPPTDFHGAKEQASTGNAPKNPVNENESEDEEGLSLSEDGKKFANIDFGDYSSSETFLKEHLNILADEEESDAILLEAFNAELEGKPSLAKQYVHQALLISYCRQLGPNGLSIFFQKIKDPNHQSQRLFLEDVHNTYVRIHERSAAISKEQAESGEGVEQIQLCAVDPNTKLSITIPEAGSTDPETQEARAAFESFPPNLQKALMTNDLDKINVVFGKMAVENAEEVVEKLSSTGMLSIEEGIIDTTKGETIPQLS